MSVIPEYRRRKFFNTVANAPVNDHALAEVGRIGIQANDRMSRSSMALTDAVFKAGSDISQGLSRIGDSVFEAGYRRTEAKYQKAQEEQRVKEAAQAKADILAERAQTKAERLAEKAATEEEKIQNKIDAFNASNAAMREALALNESLKELNATVWGEKEFKDAAIKKIEERVSDFTKSSPNDNERMYRANHGVNLVENAMKNVENLEKAKRLNNALEGFDNSARYVLEQSRNVEANEIQVREYLPSITQSALVMVGQLDGIASKEEVIAQKEKLLEGIAENTMRGVKAKDPDLALSLLNAGVFTKAKLSATGRDYVLVRDEKKIESWREELQMEIKRKEKNEMKDAHAGINKMLVSAYEKMVGKMEEGKTFDDSPDALAELYNTALQTKNPEAIKATVSLIGKFHKTDEGASDKLSQQTETEITDSYNMLVQKGLGRKHNKQTGVTSYTTGKVTLNDLASHQNFVMNAFASGKISDRQMKTHLNKISPWFTKMNSELGEDPVGIDYWADNDNLTMAWAKAEANRKYNPAVAANVVPHNRFMETAMAKIAQYRNANNGEDITEDQMEDIKSTLTGGKPLIDRRTGERTYPGKKGS